MRVIARAMGRRLEKRFPITTPRKVYRAWQDQARQQLRATVKSRRALAVVGTLHADALRYLETLSGTPLRDARNHLRHWHRTPLGKRRTETITKADLSAVVAEWLAVEDPPAANTINHRRRALVQCFTWLGYEDDNPARRLSRQRQPKPEARAIDIWIAEAIIDAMPDRGLRRGGIKATKERSKTKARFRVMLWTGIPPATMGRIRPSDVDLGRATVYLRPRRKGEGAEGVTLPLLPQGVAAFRDWLRAFAWGAPSSGSSWKSFQAGLRAYKAAEARAGRPVVLPADLRPYDLRHTFLSWFLETTGDLVATKEYAQHTDIRSTLRYTQRGASARLQKAVALCHQALPPISRVNG
jgi:integrase